MFFKFVHSPDQFPVFPGNITVILPFMRKLAECAVLVPLLVISEIPTAVFSEHIQRTVTEKTVKIFGIRPFMARKILTAFVAEK